MNYNINLNELKDIYTISNTAPFLITNFKADSSVQYLAENEPIDNLINEFKYISSKEITSMEELVYAYAIYIAILLKREDKTDHFIRSDGDIKFEWFPSIRNIYIEKMRPTNVYYIDAKSPSNPIIANGASFFYTNSVS